MMHVDSASPAWSGLDQDGKTRSSADYAGTWLLLYFYPKDDTPGCTIEACGFRDDYASLSGRISIVGVSKDDAESHRAFIKKFSLPFPLIADTDKRMIADFGADGVVFPKRVTFLIDPTGIIKKIYHGFDAKDHSKDIAKDLKELGL